MELLVVLAVIAVLACIKLPGMARVKTQMWVTQCSGNLRQIDLSFLLYANEHNDRLPSTQTGYWPWDLPDTIYQLLNHTSGIQRPTFYCPSMPYQSNLWAYGGSYHLTGYVYTYSGTGTQGGSFTGNFSTNLNASVTPLQLQMFAPGTPVILPAASKRPLTVDAEICAGPSYTPALPVANYNFSDVAGGAATFPDGRHHRSAHLVGTAPLGGNEAMLDGHVEWRPFRSPTYNMIQRNVSQPMPGTPCFLW